MSSAIAHTIAWAPEAAADKPPRRVTCARCGAAFDCGIGGECWCAAEPYRLPLPAAEDCLCRDCLRKAAGGIAALRRAHVCY
jgi:hypothetical protein